MNARWNRTTLTATLVVLAGCTEPVSPGRGGSPPSHASSPLAASSTAPDASVDGTAPAAADADGDQAEPSTAALADAMLQRQTFRHLFVGALTYPPKRLTWVLLRSPSFARLQVLCQVGTPSSGLGFSLNGKENDAALWRAPILTEYAGSRVEGEGGAGVTTYRLAVSSGPSGETGCEALPRVLRLQCRSEQVSVLAAGAALVPGKKLADDRMTAAHWQPPGRKRVTALRCDIETDGDPTAWPFHLVQSEWPLMFVAGKEGAPGIEWAYENSDEVVQEGAYRWMPAPE
jgi:hypothetical protein